jgi:TPR repeat protein
MIDLIKKAAQEGNLIPLFNESRSLGLTDIEKVSLMEQAANKGYIPAIDKLVGAYLRGRYVPQNYTKAYMWSLLWKMAKPKSPEKMKKAIDQIKEKMDNASINEAQRKAAAWLEGHPNFIE